MLAEHEILKVTILSEVHRNAYHEETCLVESRYRLQEQGLKALRGGVLIEGPVFEVLKEDRGQTQGPWVSFTYTVRCAVDSSG